MKKFFDNFNLIMSSNKTTKYLWIILAILLIFIIIHNKFFKPSISFNEFIQPHMSILYEIKNYPLIQQEKQEAFLKEKVNSINKTQVKSSLYPFDKKGDVLISYKIDNNNFTFQLAPSAYSCHFLKKIKNNNSFTFSLEPSKENLGNTTSCIRNIATINMSLDK